MCFVTGAVRTNTCVCGIVVLGKTHLFRHTSKTLVAKLRDEACFVT